MLLFKLNENILEVTEVIHSWNESKYSYWYYDIVNWRKSSNGKENDLINRDMTEMDIIWVKKYYLPKVLNEKVSSTVE